MTLACRAGNPGSIPGVGVKNERHCIRRVAGDAEPAGGSGRGRLLGWKPNPSRDVDKIILLKEM